MPAENEMIKIFHMHEIIIREAFHKLLALEVIETKLTRCAT